MRRKLIGREGWYTTALFGTKKVVVLDRTPSGKLVVKFISPVNKVSNILLVNKEDIKFEEE